VVCPRAARRVLRVAADRDDRVHDPWRGRPAESRHLAAADQLADTERDLPRSFRRPDRLRRPGRAHGPAHAGAAGADDDLGAATAAPDEPADRVHLPAAADDPGDCAGGRPRAGLRLGHLLPRRLLADPHVRVHDPRPAVRVPGDRRRPLRARRPHARGGRPEPRRRLGRRHVAGDPAEHPHRGPLRRVPRGRGGAGRVHRGLPAQPGERPGGDQPARQEQRDDVGRGLVRRAADRVRAALSALLRRPSACRVGDAAEEAP